MKQTIWWFFLVLAALSAPLFAQSADDSSADDYVETGGRIANVKVWVAPVSGGTEKEREYFDFNMPEEVKGSGYELAGSMEESDFYILFTLEHDEEYGDEVINAELYMTKTDALIITNTMGYTAVEDMNDWNLTMIYQLMANAPLNKYISSKEWKAPPPPKPALGFPEYWLYLGFRVGYSNRQYSAPSGYGYIETTFSRGHSFEGAVQVSFQPLRFLALQAEALFTTDSAPFQYHVNEDNTVKTVTDTYDSFSMMIPLTVKGTFQFYDRLAVNPFAGAYVVIPGGTLKIGEKKAGFKYNIPLGWTAGAEVGIVLGKRGTVFLDARYSGDFGKVQWKETGETVYKKQGMFSITAGYRYGFIKRKAKAKVKEDIPEDFNSSAWDDYVEQ